MAYRMGIGAGRVGVGANFAKSRLMLARRAGYLPSHTQISQSRAPDQWKKASSNLVRDARQAGFRDPLMFLRAQAQRGGDQSGRRPGIPRRASEEAPLAYAASTMAMRGTGQQPFRMGGIAIPPNEQTKLMPFALPSLRTLPGLPKLGGGF